MGRRKQRTEPILCGLWCEDCKKQKPDVKERLCPYDLDVHDGLETPITVCDECYHERGMAI